MGPYNPLIDSIFMKLALFPYAVALIVFASCATPDLGNSRMEADGSITSDTPPPGWNEALGRDAGGRVVSGAGSVLR